MLRKEGVPKRNLKVSWTNEDTVYDISPRPNRIPGVTRMPNSTRRRRSNILGQEEISKILSALPKTLSKPLEKVVQPSSSTVKDQKKKALKKDVQSEKCSQQALLELQKMFGVNESLNDEQQTNDFPLQQDTFETSLKQDELSITSKQPLVYELLASPSSASKPIKSTFDQSSKKQIDLQEKAYFDLNSMFYNENFYASDNISMKQCDNESTTIDDQKDEKLTMDWNFDEEAKENVPKQVEASIENDFEMQTKSLTTNLQRGNQEQSDVSILVLHQCTEDHISKTVNKSQKHQEERVENLVEDSSGQKLVKDLAEVLQELVQKNDELPTKDLQDKVNAEISIIELSVEEHDKTLIGELQYKEHSETSIVELSVQEHDQTIVERNQECVEPSIMELPVEKRTETLLNDEYSQLFHEQSSIIADQTINELPKDTLHNDNVTKRRRQRSLTEVQDLPVEQNMKNPVESYQTTLDLQNEDETLQTTSEFLESVLNVDSVEALKAKIKELEEINQRILVKESVLKKERDILKKEHDELETKYNEALASNSSKNNEIEFLKMELAQETNKIQSLESEEKNSTVLTRIDSAQVIKTKDFASSSITPTSARSTENVMQSNSFSASSPFLSGNQLNKTHLQDNANSTINLPSSNSINSTSIQNSFNQPTVQTSIQRGTKRKLTDPSSDQREQNTNVQTDYYKHLLSIKRQKL